MKATFDIPEDLLAEAGKLAAELCRPLGELVTEGLRAQVASGGGRKPHVSQKRTARRIGWVTVQGALVPGLVLDDRERMHDRPRRIRNRDRHDPLG